MNDDEPKFNLRDQMAIEILSAMISTYPPINATTSGWPVPGYVALDYDQEMERIAKIAYKMADVMRKTRLKVFE